jgi:Flp pilus assembly protein TadG
MESADMSVFERFRHSERGNVATMFALALVPVFGVVGAAIDYARVSEVKAQLADALDAGVLAVGSQSNMDDDKAFEIINDWITAHLGDKYTGMWKLDSATVGEDGSIVATASGSVDTTMARVLGIYEMPISVTSEAIRSLGKVEVALVLDNTGSMKGTKLTKLKEAATALVESLADSTTEPEDLRIALVPFSQTVRLSDDQTVLSGYKADGWVDKDAKSSIHNDIFTKDDGTTYTTNINRFTHFSTMKVNWAGCIESRPYPYDVEETPPDSGTPDTLYVPYFAPDEPDTTYKSKGKWYAAYNNNYITDKSSDTKWKGKQGNPAKYASKWGGKSGTTGELGYIYGPNSGCELEPIVRLSDDGTDGSLDAIYDAIDDMVAVGNTHINVGLQWGWHVLSPNAPFNDGVAYDDNDWNKVVVLMTDGNNANTDTVSQNQNRSVYSGYSYLWQNRFGTTSTDEDDRTDALDERLTELCDNMKADDVGIVIYTVRVEVKDGSASALEGCATEDKYFYEVADINDLEEAFADIGGSIQKLRLSK